MQQLLTVHDEANRPPARTSNHVSLSLSHSLLRFSNSPTLRCGRFRPATCFHSPGDVFSNCLVTARGSRIVLPSAVQYCTCLGSSFSHHVSYTSSLRGNKCFIMAPNTCRLDSPMISLLKYKTDLLFLAGGHSRSDLMALRTRNAMLKGGNYGLEKDRRYSWETSYDHYAIARTIRLLFVVNHFLFVIYLMKIL